MGKFVDILNKRFGKLKTIKYIGGRNSKWICECDCGNKVNVAGYQLRKGAAIECNKCAVITNRDRLRYDFTGQSIGEFNVLEYKGNLKYECICINNHKQLISTLVLKRNIKPECRQCRIDSEKMDMVGKRIGSWVVESLSDFTKYHDRYWVCRCDCGTVATLRGGHLRNGRISNCIKCKGKIGYGVSAFNKVYYAYKRGAKIRGLEWALTIDEFKNIVQSNCFYTNLPPSSVAKNEGGSFVYNGIDRIENDKGYTMDNCVPCNGIINRMKSALSYSEFVSLCSLVAKTISEKNITELIKNKLKAV